MQLHGGLCEGKNWGLLSEEECFVYILSGEYVKSMVFKFIWASFKISFNPVISLNLLASRRDPNLCPALEAQC